MFITRHLPHRLQYTIHNMIGHPVMELCYLIGKGELGDRVHDITLPYGYHHYPQGHK